MMKKTRLITVVMISAALTACGSKETSSFVTEGETAIQEAGTTLSAEGEGGEFTLAVEGEEISSVEIKKEGKPVETEESKETPAEEGKTGNFVEAQSEQKKEGVYEDNFEVETSEAAAFADKIKAAVAAKDIEALADLTAFPVYVGIVEGGVETREAFIALGAERIFTPELVEAVEGADISNLLPSMAGFSISKDGKSNIIFGVVEGRLAISGINYE